MKRIFLTLSILFACITLSAQSLHPWQGKRVGYIGDSITDPNCLTDVHKYWEFLQEWLQITPYVTAISGREWNDVPRQAQQIKEEHGGEVDAILVFMGTNDYNSGVPIGEWFTETEEKVWAATGKPQQEVVRKRRHLVLTNDTFKGRIRSRPKTSPSGSYERHLQRTHQPRNTMLEATLSRQADYPTYTHPSGICILRQQQRATRRKLSKSMR